MKCFVDGVAISIDDVTYPDMNFGQPPHDPSLSALHYELVYTLNEFAELAQDLYNDFTSDIGGVVNKFQEWIFAQILRYLLRG